MRELWYLQDGYNATQEEVRASQEEKRAVFLRELVARVQQAKPGAEVSVDDKEDRYGVEADAFLLIDGAPVRIEFKFIYSKAGWRGAMTDKLQITLRTTTMDRGYLWRHGVKLLRRETKAGIQGMDWESLVSHAMDFADSARLRHEHETAKAAAKDLIADEVAALKAEYINNEDYVYLKIEDSEVAEVELNFCHIPVGVAKKLLETYTQYAADMEAHRAKKE